MPYNYWIFLSCLEVYVCQTHVKSHADTVIACDINIPVPTLYLSHLMKQKWINMTLD